MRTGRAFLILSVVWLAETTPLKEKLRSSAELGLLPKKHGKRDASEVCDFGSDTYPTTCDWTSPNGTAPEWMFGTGTLSNWLGGPTVDSSGKTSGGYLFFESSRLPSDSKNTQSAVFESPPIPTTGSEGKCISFNYDMMGLSIVGLRVLLQPIHEEDEYHKRVLWTSNDITQKGWRRAQILYTYNKEHKLVFEGLARNQADPLRKYRGFVAVDNLGRESGSKCNGQCTFEGGFCSWYNEEGDDFQWSLGRGSINPSTGPAVDRPSSHHGGLEGGYAYIDSSFPRNPGDVAILSSETFSAVGPDDPVCFRFWTHMYGNGIGSLSVVLDDKEYGTITKLWSLSGEGGNLWLPAQVTVAHPNAFRLLFEGRVGHTPLGNIAIDDVSFTPGSCPVGPEGAAVLPGDCTFEEGECGWTNTGPSEGSNGILWDRITGHGLRPLLTDHTSGTPRGHFMNLGGGGIQKPGSRGVLTGTDIADQHGVRCMTFWYIMNEPYAESNTHTLGSLAVYTKSFDQDRGHVVTPKWQLYNHQGPQWKYAQVPINEVNYSVAIEGTWGSARSQGFISIDDVAFYDGNCDVFPQHARVHEGDCHFDSDTCDWTIHTKRDPSSPTWRLPSLPRRPYNLEDRTFGAPEGYVYFEVFSPYAPTAADAASITSPKISANGDSHCMKFWFAALGAGRNSRLSVIRWDCLLGNESHKREVWEFHAEDLLAPSQVWVPAQVTLDGSTDYVVQILGAASDGGFAVDDITFTKGNCPVRPQTADVVPT